MSRIGKMPIPLPPKVQVSVKENVVKVKGPQGELTKAFKGPIEITVEDGKVRISKTDESRFAGMMHGTVRSIINSMVKGVVEGYKIDLEIQGTGFKANLQGSNLNLALGYSHPINYPVPVGVKVVVTDQTKLQVTGPDKQLVGQVAADIFNYYPVEPYKGKGVRKVGAFVRRKEGKKAG